MQTVKGKSVLDQAVVGKLKFCQLAPPRPQPLPALHPREEATRFAQAQRLAVLDLAALYDRASQQIGEETASIFAIHAMLLEDNDFEQSVHRIIREEETCAEWAVWKTGSRLASTFTTMDNLYMRARAGDIRDIT